jgi:hypothetical protein
MSFSSAQPIYAERGIVTFPVRFDPVTLRKRPAVRGFLKIGPDRSRELVTKFPNTDGIGFATNQHNGVTVLDIDTTDERVLADALSRHGSTPLVARTGSGKFHGYYRHNGERRRIRPWRGLAIDLLGTGGFVVAPPSEVNGAYSFIQGSLDDVDRLPVLRNLDQEKPVKEGARNSALWRHCMRHAHHVESSSQG